MSSLQSSSSATPLASATHGRPPWPVIFLLMAITGIGSLALTVLVPAVPGLAVKLATDPANVQLTVTMFMLGLALSQLVLGPLSDRIGRRPVLLIGLAVVAGTSVAAIFMTSIEALVAMRVVQAFGAATGQGVGRAVIRDLVDRERTASLLGLVAAVMVIAPTLAPVIGGLLDTYFGWESIFIFVAALGAILFGWAFAILPETRPASSKAGFGAFLSDMAALLRNRSFLSYIFINPLNSSPFFVVLGGGPYLVISQLGHSSAEYGLWFAIPSIGYMLGNLISSRYSTRYGIHALIRWGIWITMVGCFINVAFIWWAPASLAAFFLPSVFSIIGNGLVVPNCLAGAVSVRPLAAGAASGIAGCVQMLSGAVIAQGASYLIVGHTSGLPLALLAAVCSIVPLIFYAMIRKS